MSLIAVLFTALPAHAATLTVNSIGDEGDAAPGDGLCATAGSTCTLRAAVNEANSLAGADVITFDIPGAGPHTIQPATAIVITQPVMIDGYSQPGSVANNLATGTNATLMIELDGQLADASGVGMHLYPGGSGSTIAGLVMNRFAHSALQVNSGSNKVQGNYIGTNVSGTSALPNGYGIVVSGLDNSIGGSNPEARNLISGNNYTGLTLNIGTARNQVKGNLVGTDASGTAALGNSTGVTLGRANNNIIGGASPGEANVFSGNRSWGVSLALEANSNVIEGNLIGTDAAGTSALGNASGGLQLSGSNDNIVGGVEAGAGNVISGNARGIAGVYVRNSSNNTFKGNFIGTDATATTRIANSYGLGISGGSGHVVGGSEAGAGNVISANNLPGIYLSSTTTNTVQGNFIGTNAAGSTTLGNATEGVYLRDAPGNTIGGTKPEAGNVIRNNGTKGIALISAGGVVSSKILGNSILQNGQLGIDLGANGRTNNDHQDPDAGPNDLQNYPVLATTPGSTAIGGSLNSTPNTTFRVEFFANSACDSSGYGEGERFVGFEDVTTDANGDAPIDATFGSLTVGDVVTATATAPNGVTSEFSACRTLTPAPSADLGVTTTDSPDPVRVGQDLTYTVTVTNNGPSDATGVVFTDDMPASTDFVSATPSQGADCVHDAGAITCALGGLAKDASATVEIVVTPTAAGEITNTASVDGNEVDDVSTNDSDEEITTVEGAGPCSDEPRAWCTPPGDSDFESSDRMVRVVETSDDVTVRGDGNKIILESGFSGTLTVVGDGNVVYGSGAGDRITVRGCGNKVRAGAGADTVIVDCPAPGSPMVTVSIGGGTSIDLSNAVWGGAGGDNLRNRGDLVAFFGHSGADTLLGGGAADVLRGNRGHDTIQGRAGADHAAGGGGQDEVRGGAGDDVLRGSGGADVVRGGGDNDDLFGGKGPDELRGGPGDDALHGGPDADTCLGGEGGDTFFSC